jgi:L-ascorbate metabolism protein UlaG (beta-lactamase superfamily)
MQITHFGHACLLVETGDVRILFDPGTLSRGFETLTDLTAILITHQHDDHVDADRLPALMAANPRAVLYGSSETIDFLEVGTVTVPGDSLDIDRLTVDVVGGRHHTVYGAEPDMANLGYVVDKGAFYHPGDALDVPDGEIYVLGLPIAGPWLKLADTIDFMKKVSPRVAIPMHEAGLSDTGVYYFLTSNFTPVGVKFTPLDAGVAQEF